MKSNCKLISLLILAVLMVVTVSSCGTNSESEKWIRDYRSIVESKDLGDIRLTIYCVEPDILTRTPWTAEDLMHADDVIKTVVSGSELQKHLELLDQINDDVWKPVKNGSAVNARIYYVFEKADGSKIMDVAMWGNDNNIFVNGMEVEENDAFYNVISPFLSGEYMDRVRSYKS